MKKADCKLKYYWTWVVIHTILQLHWQSSSAYFTIHMCKNCGFGKFNCFRDFYCCMFALSCVYHNTSADQLNQISENCGFCKFIRIICCKKFPLCCIVLKLKFQKNIFSGMRQQRLICKQTKKRLK